MTNKNRSILLNGQILNTHVYDWWSSELYQKTIRLFLETKEKNFLKLMDHSGVIFIVFPKRISNI